MMSTLCGVARPVAKGQPEVRKHLQRLVRKLNHVLVVKHYIDDLKNGAAGRRGGSGGSGGSGGGIAGEGGKKRQNILDELPSGPEILPDLGSGSNSAMDAIKSTLEETSSSLLPNAVLSNSIPGPTGTLDSFENELDSYISVAYHAVRKCKQRVIDSSQNFWDGWRWSREPSVRDSFWMSWAKKRATSVRDSRALALIDGSDEVEEGLGLLKVVQEYLEAYRKGSYGRPTERLSEVVTRLRAVFGIGWFFEWPSGQHPLNSTWPWADVKPSLLVLWGVCWQFFAAPYDHPARPGHPLGQLQSRPYNNFYNNFDFLSQANRTTNTSNVPQNFFNMGYYDTLWMPETNPTNLANTPGPPQGRYANPAADMIGHYPHRPLASEFAGHDSSHLRNFTSDSYDSTTIPSSSWTATQPDLSRGRVAQYRTRVQAPNQLNHNPTHAPRHHSQPRRRVAEQLPQPQPLWHTPIHLTQSRGAPDPLGENPLNQAAIPLHSSRPSILNRTSSLQPSPTSMSASMPSANFSSYPPLDQMTELHNTQPYLVGQERAYQDMPEYEQHHNPQDQQRYPTPPPPLTDPYHTQQGIDGTADGRLDLPMDQKSDSDALSPGRSKPVPKPDREVTKDANGRFYCSWQGCTEEIKDFGRKCEWSKHMDKHDRPYKCPAEGCEKLPGFTYSGGLLRHEREVHNKHGGPRKQLNCPHPNCKRHTGKGFSRQENLNEHLRRVHTDAGVPLAVEDTEDEANEQLGVKRKRVRADSADLREEMKRLKAENEELKRQAEAQTAQSAEMMRQIMQLQQTQQIMQHPRMQAPPAQMT